MDLEGLNEKAVYYWSYGTFRYGASHQCVLSKPSRTVNKKVSKMIEARKRELTQQLAENQSLLAQIVASKWVSSAAMSIPWQEPTPSALATITISNNTILESVITPARDMKIDPLVLDFTTIGIADTFIALMTMGNPCTSDTENEPIISLHFLINDSKLLLCNQLRNEDIFCQCCVGS